MRVDCRVAVLEPKRGSPQVLACGPVFFTATLTPARPVWGKLRQGGPATQWMKVPNGCQPATGISGIVRAAATGTPADGTCSTQHWQGTRPDQRIPLSSSLQSLYFVPRIHPANAYLGGLEGTLPTNPTPEAWDGGYRLAELLAGRCSCKFQRESFCQVGLRRSRP
jgi:hypothetical protein